VCAAGAAEKLIGLGYQVQGFYYNPNIYPGAEYNHRLEVVRGVAAKLDSGSMKALILLKSGTAP